jgi:SAM-dependent methyltransferase
VAVRTRGQPPRADYRLSHSAPGYGEHYDALYRRGYEREQWTRLERPFLQDTFRDLAASGARSILDFACGTGRILELAESYFPVTWGVDVSAPMLEIAQRRCRGSMLLLTDLTVNPMEFRFDVVTAFRFFLGAEPELRSAALRSLRAMLRPGGTLIANVHVNRSSPLGVAERLAKRLSPGRDVEPMGFDEFEALLTAHGFQIRTLHWYSYLPRTGPWLRWLPRYLMSPVETVCTRLPLVPKWIAQSFVVVCEAG